MSDVEVTEADKAAAGAALNLGLAGVSIRGNTARVFALVARAIATARVKENMACYAAAMVTCAGCNGQGTAPSNRVLGGGLECGECQGTGAGTIGEALDAIAKRRKSK